MRMKYLVQFQALVIEADSVVQALRIAVFCEPAPLFDRIREATEREAQEHLGPSARALRQAGRA